MQTLSRLGLLSAAAISLHAADYNGDGTFADVTEKAGITTANARATGNWT
jgi:hypothetical protein